MRKSLYAALICATALMVIAAAAPAVVNQTIGGGKGHYTATLATNAYANVSDGLTVKAGGVNDQTFSLWVDNGTVSVTPQAGYYLYNSDGVKTGTRWVDLDTLTGVDSSGAVVRYPIACDLVRIKATSCTACVFTAAWVGIVR